MRVHITDVRSGDQLTEDIFNSFGLHVLSKGVILNEKELTRLFQHQVDYVEIEWRPSSAPSSKFEEIDSKPLYNPILRSIYKDAISGVEKLFERALEENRIYEEDVKESFQPFVDNFRNESDVVSLLLLLNSQDDYTYQHSVQVGMLSYFIARWMGSSEEETIRAGKAGFLHDIGKCKVPEAILNKPDRLTDEEFQQIKKHAQLGYDMLKNSFDDNAIALAALQHHERMNGSGYPLGLTRENIHPLARIVAIADVYSAMISTRVYKEKRDLLYVLKELHELSFQELDPDITHTFIRHMIPNFIGKNVELNTGEMGTIVMIHPTDFFRPLVQVGEQFIDLSIQRKQEIKEVFM
jgi:putative nucleotidyltransferase with HDIG domain